MKIIKSMEHDVSFIPIESCDEDNLLLNGYSENSSAEKGKESSSNILGKIDRYFFNRIKNRILRKKQFKIYDEFRKKYLHYISVGLENSDRFYDYCVIGSDEVFNCLYKTPWGFTSQLFGNVRNAKNVISYAASCGSTIAEKVPKDAKKCISDSLHKLTMVSVRDQNTEQFVEEIANMKPEIHLDPVLIGNFESEIAESDVDIKLPKKYCLVYSYDNRIHDIHDISSILEFCKKYNLTPVCVGIPQFWIKKYITATPFQCLKIFNGAEFVITDTFHGAIFSAKYSNRFSILIRESNKNKLGDLIKRIGLLEHQIDSVSFQNLEKAYSTVFDKIKFDRLIDDQLKQSIMYLSNAIK